MSMDTHWFDGVVAAIPQNSYFGGRVLQFVTVEYAFVSNHEWPTWIPLHPIPMKSVYAVLLTTRVV